MTVSVVDPKVHDRRTVDEKFGAEEKRADVLPFPARWAVPSTMGHQRTGDVGESSDSRLAALKGTQAVLSGVQAGVNHGLQQQSADPNNGIGVSICSTISSRSLRRNISTISSPAQPSAPGKYRLCHCHVENKDHNNSGDMLIIGEPD